MTPTLIHPTSRVFVSKPWGWEDWLYNDEELDLGMKKLFIKAAHGCSMHRHPIKEEVIICESGMLMFEYQAETPASPAEYMMGLEAFALTPGLAVHVPPGTWHRLAAIEDTYLYEAGTFHRDEDSERMAGWEEMAKHQPTPADIAVMEANALQHAG